MDISSIQNTKYIICYPGGGFNDMLNVILLCYKHALIYNRILVIDSRFLWFKEHIHNYITFKSDIIYKGDIDALFKSIENETIYPLELKGNLINPTIRFNNEFKCYFYKTTNTRINLNNDYNESVIVYSNCGFGHNILDLLKISVFTPIVLNVFNSRRALLPKSYISVHIRNTDYKSDIDEFLRVHMDKLSGNPIFLASDNYKTICKMKELFGENLYTFSNISDNNDQNIHYNHSAINTREFNIDCIVDFLLLASGDKIYYSSKESSYSRNAVALQSNQDILKKCLNLLE